MRSEAVIFERRNRAGDGLVIREDEAVEISVSIDGRRQSAILDEQDVQALKVALARRDAEWLLRAARRVRGPRFHALEGGR